MVEDQSIPESGKGGVGVESKSKCESSEAAKNCLSLIPRQCTQYSAPVEQRHKLFAEKYYNAMYGEETYYHYYGVYDADGDGFTEFNQPAGFVISMCFFIIVIIGSLLFVYYCIFNRERVTKPTERQQEDMFELVRAREQ